MANIALLSIIVYVHLNSIHINPKRSNNLYRLNKSNQELEGNKEDCCSCTEHSENHNKGKTCGEGDTNANESLVPTGRKGKGKSKIVVKPYSRKAPKKSIASMASRKSVSGKVLRKGT
jgi:hypothetical protein